MPLREYLYIDHTRLDRYFEQISGPVTYDKVSVGSSGISIAGPKADVTQARYPRPYTTHEKIEALTAYLEERRLLMPSPIYGTHWQGGETNRFVRQRCRSIRVAVPRLKVGGDHPTPAFVLWLARCPAQGVGWLCLLEGFGGDDRPPEGYRVTQYTLFEALVRFAEDRIGCSVLRTISAPETGEYVSEPDDEELSNAAISSWEPFRRNPTAFLSHWGCIVSSPRSVEVFYRVRATHPLRPPHSDTTQWTFDVMAYPIWIAA